MSLRIILLSLVVAFSTASQADTLDERWQICLKHANMAVLAGRVPKIPLPGVGQRFEPNFEDVCEPVYIAHEARRIASEKYKSNENSLDLKKLQDLSK